MEEELEKCRSSQKMQLKNSIQKRTIPSLFIGIIKSREYYAFKRYRLPEKKQLKIVIHFVGIGCA